MKKLPRESLFLAGGVVPYLGGCTSGMAGLVLGAGSAIGFLFGVLVGRLGGTLLSRSERIVLCLLFGSVLGTGASILLAYLQVAPANTEGIALLLAACPAMLLAAEDWGASASGPRLVHGLFVISFGLLVTLAAAGMLHELARVGAAFGQAIPYVPRLVPALFAEPSGKLFVVAFAIAIARLLADRGRERH